MGPTGENDVTDAVRARSSVTTQRIGAKSNPFMRETTPTRYVRPSIPPYARDHPLAKHGGGSPVGERFAVSV